MCTHPLVGKSLGLSYLYHLYLWLSDSTGSPYSFELWLGGGSAGCNASIISFYGEISGIIGLFGRGLGGIGTTTDTVVVTLYFDVTGCGMFGSSTGSATETISGWTIDIHGAIIAAASAARVI